MCIFEARKIQIDSNLLVRIQTESSLVCVSIPKEKTGTRGMPYKFAILKGPQINTYWESCSHFLLPYTN